SLGSFGMSRILISPSSVSRRASSDSSSSCASSRMSGSFSSSCVAATCSTTDLYSRNASTSGCMSAAALECARNFAVSAWTAGSAISAMSWSYLASTALSLSSINPCRSASRHRREEGHFVAVAQRGRHARVVFVDRAGDRPLVGGEFRVPRRQGGPDVANLRPVRHVDLQLLAADDLTQPREQPDRY